MPTRAHLPRAVLCQGAYSRCRIPASQRSICPVRRHGEDDQGGRWANPTAAPLSLPATDRRPPTDRPTVRRPRQHHPLRAAPSTACRLPHHPLRAAPTAAPTRPPRRPDRSTVSTAALTRLPATDCRLPTHRPPRVAPQRRCPPHNSRTAAPSTARRADHHPVSTAAPSRPSYRTSRHADSTAAPSRPPATDLRPTDRLTTVPPCRPPYAAPTAAMRPVCR